MELTPNAGIASPQMLDENKKFRVTIDHFSSPQREILRRPILEALFPSTYLNRKKRFRKPTAVHYVHPVNKSPIYLKFCKNNTPISDTMSSKVLSLPMHPYLTAEDQKYIFDSISEAKEKLNRVRPKSISQASRISGIKPSDLSVILVELGR